MALRLYDLLADSGHGSQFLTRTDPSLTAITPAKVKERERTRHLSLGFRFVLDTIFKIRLFAEAFAIGLAMVALLVTAPLPPALTSGMVISMVIGLIVTGLFAGSAALALSNHEERKAFMRKRSFQLIRVLWRLFGLSPIALLLVLIVLATRTY
jgi:hypothetical protein